MINNAQFIPCYISQGSLIKDVGYDHVSLSISKYNNNDPLEFIVNESNKYAKQYGIQNKYIIAETSNCAYDECGYTGFEYDELGGWSKNESNLFEKTEFYTGTTSMLVNSVYGPGKEFPVGIQANNHSGYQASVWVKGSKNAYLHIEANGWSVHERISNVEETDGWHLLKVILYKHQYESLIDSNLIIRVYVGNDGSDIAYFDDLRFYPLDAEMTTYTHEPFIGVTSVSDNNNKPTRYEYDAFGRLMHTRDFKDNILKKNEYHYKP